MPGVEKEASDAVFLDGDWCRDADPFQVSEETKAMVLQNICFMLNSFLRCSAYENVIFCWVMHEQAMIDTIRRNLNEENRKVITVSLMVNENDLRNRLEKDIRSGLRSADVMEKSAARIAMYNKLNTVKIDTSHKTAGEVADMIRQLS